MSTIHVNPKDYTRKEVRNMMDNLVDILDDLDAINTKQEKILEDDEIMEQRIQTLELQVDRFVIQKIGFSVDNFKNSALRLKEEQTELEGKVGRLEYRRRLRSSH
jgi:hypothetical protein